MATCKPPLSHAGVTLRSEVPAQPETETVLPPAGPGQDPFSFHSVRGLAQTAPGTQVWVVHHGPTRPVFRVAAPSGRPSPQNPSPNTTTADIATVPARPHSPSPTSHTPGVVSNTIAARGRSPRYATPTPLGYRSACAVSLTC